MQANSAQSCFGYRYARTVLIMRLVPGIQKQQCLPQLIWSQLALELKIAHSRVTNGSQRLSCAEIPELPWLLKPE